MNNPESGTGVSSLESISSIFNIKINVDTISVSVEEASIEIQNLESYSPTITMNIGQPEKMWINIINWIVAAVTAISIFRDIWEATSKKSATKKMQEGIEQFTNSLTTMKDNLNKANLETVGKAIGDGLIAGLKTAIEDIKLLMIEIAVMICDTIKDKMKVQSPSKVMQAFGKFISDGLGIGITDGAKDYTKSLDAVGDATDKVNKKRFLLAGFSPS